MPLSLVSFNYKHTPLALRELLNVPSARLPALLDEVRQACALDELMVLSTCNRVEHKPLVTRSLEIVSR